MSTGLIIAIVVFALTVLVALLVLGRRARAKRLDKRQHLAREIRREADMSRVQAERTSGGGRGSSTGGGGVAVEAERERAEAEKRAAEARREEIQAREQVAAADARSREAGERAIEAAFRKDPDADADEVAERFDREHGTERREGEAGRERGQDRAPWPLLVVAETAGAGGQGCQAAAHHHQHDASQAELDAVFSHRLAHLSLDDARADLPDEPAQIVHLAAIGHGRPLTLAHGSFTAVDATCSGWKASTAYPRSDASIMRSVCEGQPESLAVEGVDRR